MRGDSGVAGEGRVASIPNFHSWGKCTMSLTNINSDLDQAQNRDGQIFIKYLITCYWEGNGYC